MDSPIDPSTQTWSTTPDALLIRIFEYGALLALHDRDLPFAILVTHICRRWRSLVLLSPSVWCKIPIHHRRAGLTKFLLNHVGATAPISVSIHVDAEDKPYGPQEKDLRLVFAHANSKRITALYVRVHRGGSRTYIGGLLGGRAETRQLPALEHLELISAAPDGGNGLSHPLSVEPGPWPLRSLVLHRADSYYRSKLLTGLTRLTWAILVNYIPPLSYATLRDLAVACPALEYLKLDGVFPILSEGVSYPKLHWDSLHTLELTMDENPTSKTALVNNTKYVSTFLSLFSVPAARVFAFESGWPVAWVEIWNALPALERTLPAIRTLRLSVTTDDYTPDASPALYDAFAQLRCLTLACSAKQLRLFLRPWLARSRAAAPGTGWPHLELLTLRLADGGAGAVDREIADGVALIASAHKAARGAFAVFWDTAYVRSVP